ncbi:L-ascorbate metabolism protein UlaG (beta-lactamase superfamily) [Streptomyces sp. Ag109_G2-6]|uniref:MBL fold metallo-hydrolase n=1 Tax=Streptomyces TaxID=1883 RepID=UPI000F967076|nr:MULTISPECIES: MBL fold metallo-hydrolase [Streptomyces]RPF44587.1 L-ascorbate metabolism protein UlaG (beta-lactamase superfamily) [Streptomyces sp. Ag109_G2-6]
MRDHPQPPLTNAATPPAPAPAHPSPSDAHPPERRPEHRPEPAGPPGTGHRAPNLRAPNLRAAPPAPPACPAPAGALPPGAAPAVRPGGRGSGPRPLGEMRAWPGSFADRLTTPLPGVRAFARLAREGAFRPGPEGLRGIPDLPYRPAPLPAVGPGEVCVTWAGHASWVVRTGGLTVLTDPVWSRRILGTPARMTPPGVRWEELPPVDAVVISHNHYDHLDAPTLKRLPRDTALFVPAGLARWCRRRGFRQVTELDWWESAELGGVRFEFVPAHHWSKRSLLDTCRTLWGGWVLTDRTAATARTGGGRTVYFAGDTGYGHWFREIGARHPAIALALLPIGAYAPRWWLRDVHTDPEEAVRAFLDLGARRMAPMHWAAFVLSAEPVMEPLHRVRAAWARAGLPREDLWDLPVGASRTLGASRTPGADTGAPGRHPSAAREAP